ncbi:helix-turn-helix domain-containing protein [Bacillus sp. AR18-7]|uniref:helix-turn-helix domain-containing protein n=1 Tax=Bacillus sp. AR18-7 TaxID=2217821 RepID=UPI00351A37B4
MLETRKKWERLCKEAIILRKKGMSYYKISKKLNCGSSSLYKYFKKWVHIQRT